MTIHSSTSNWLSQRRIPKKEVDQEWYGQSIALGLSWYGHGPKSPWQHCSCFFICLMLTSAHTHSWRPRWLNFERDSSKIVLKIQPSEKFSPNIRIAPQNRAQLAPSLFQNYYYNFPYTWIFWYGFLYVVCLWVSLLHRHICWALKY